jgi:hypothetical protein
MNHSIYSADRTTHLKIIITALLAAIAMAIIGISARVGASTESVAVIDAGKPMVTTSAATLTR